MAEKNVDPLNLGKLGEDYGFARDMIASDDSLIKLFKWAASQGANLPDNAFLARLKNTSWWTKSSQSYRSAYKAEFFGDTTWSDEIMPRARTRIAAAAAAIGVSVTPEQQNRLARLAEYGGWSDEELTSALVTGSDMTGEGIKNFKGLSERSGDLRGNAKLAYDTLQTYAEDSGVRYTDEWYRMKALQILNPNSGVNPNDIYMEIGEKAKSKYPALANEIGWQGTSFVTVRSAASPYIQTIADTLELDASEINLNDRLLSSALRQTDSANKHTLTPLWKVEEDAIADERWQATSAGRRANGNLAALISSTFGVGF